jgi:thioesterase domain-containing protein
MAKALGVEIVVLDPDEVRLTAPLSLNHNHLGTAFGGSLGAMMILACYAWLFNRMGVEGKNCHVLVQSAHTEYLKPVTGDLLARCAPVNSIEIEQALRQFERKGTGRVTLHSEMLSPTGEILCRFYGEFVAKA